MPMELIHPSVQYKHSFLEAVREFQTEGRNSDINLSEIENDFDSFVAKINDQAEGKNLPEGWVPQTVFWLVNNGIFIGKVSVRHLLTEKLLQIGGHIGYEIRPSEREKGYGKEILKMVLPKAKELGIQKALVTCDSTNIASRKIIESAGGILENEIAGENGTVSKLRFWIEL